MSREIHTMSKLMKADVTLDELCDLLLRLKEDTSSSPGVKVKLSVNSSNGVLDLRVETRDVDLVEEMGTIIRLDGWRKIS
jgi:hypothetical protein